MLHNALVSVSNELLQLKLRCEPITRSLGRSVARSIAPSPSPSIWPRLTPRRGTWNQSRNTRGAATTSQSVHTAARLHVWRLQVSERRDPRADSHGEQTKRECRGNNMCQPKRAHVAGLPRGVPRRQKPDDGPQHQNCLSIRCLLGYSMHSVRPQLRSKCSRPNRNREDPRANSSGGNPDPRGA